MSDRAPALRLKINGVWTEVAAIKGEKGDAYSTITVDSTVTSNAGTEAYVENIGTDNDVKLKFYIPRGADGASFTFDDLTEEQKESLRGEKGDTGSALTWDDLTDEQKASLRFKYSDFTPEQLASLKGQKGDAFTYADFTEEQLASLKGEKGNAFTYSDFTEEQLASLKGEKGDSLTFEELTDEQKDELSFHYSDFTEEQLEALRGEKGDALTFDELTDEQKDELSFHYSDFTEEQLESLKGEDGYTPVKGIDYFDGEQGIPGVQGEKGNAFTYSDFTEEQLEGLRGPQGLQGIQGVQGIPGPKGDAFTYSDFTEEQLEGLKVKGDKGDDYDKSQLTFYSTATLLQSGWSGYRQTVSITNFDSTTMLTVALPIGNYTPMWVSSNIYAESSSGSNVTFVCSSVPLSNIEVGFMIIPRRI